MLMCENGQVTTDELHKVFLYVSQSVSYETARVQLIQKNLCQIGSKNAHSAKQAEMHGLRHFRNVATERVMNYLTLSSQ
jgi:hypothetical protein